MPSPISVADRVEITELLSRYARSMDEANADGMIACFVPEPSLDIHGKLVEGAAELRAFAEDYCSWPGRPGWQHHISSIVFDCDDEQCQAKSYVMWITRNLEGEMTLRGCSEYVDDCVRVEGRWLFARHVAQY